MLVKLKVKLVLREVKLKKGELDKMCLITRRF